MTKVDDYYTANEVMALFSFSRQRVSVIARREDWHFVQVGNAKLYAKEDVDRYAWLRTRTELLRELGWTGVGLARDGSDSICPQCKERCVYQVDWDTAILTRMCVNHHRIETDYSDRWGAQKTTE